ncbi:beta-1,3-galactosyltransferase 6-like [Montipora capricornis]|uniref:beta-1,3-galactosyltransferase 6-like n=1 Tax=Montipora capricornis TaxID=246305 RepID=UPI0035F1C95B
MEGKLCSRVNLRFFLFVLSLAVLLLVYAAITTMPESFAQPHVVRNFTVTGSSRESTTIDSTSQATMDEDSLTTNITDSPPTTSAYIDGIMASPPTSSAGIINSPPTKSDHVRFLPILDFNDLGGNKTKLLLLIVVSSAPQRMARRQGIRETWWKHCTGNQVRCFFVTDGFILNDARRDLLLQERNQYKDIELQPLLGWEFGLRFLSQIKWAYAKFDFQYLLRIDDDYFLCLKRLLAELPVRPKENLIWGHFHCEAGITWIDESFMIFTPDIIYKFLSQNESTMLCHPHADQQIGLWLNHIPTKQFFHDGRLHHDPPASFSSKFNKITNVCRSYLGIHGTYGEKMVYFGQNANDGRKRVSSLPDFVTFCRTTNFDHRVFGPEWRYEPKLCKGNPRWNPEKEFHVGRENKV